METGLSLNLARTAVLAMDCQSGIVSMYAKDAEEFLSKASGILRAARDVNMPIIHVQVGFRPGLPEVSSRNKLFAAIKSSVQHQQLFQGAAGVIHSALGPEPNDIVVTKHRISAFTGTDLEMILRAKEIETLALFGIATSGVVLSTLLDACDADYNVIVIADCCADIDAELHEVLLKSLYPKRGEVRTAAEFIRAINGV